VVFYSQVQKYSMGSSAERPNEDSNKSFHFQKKNARGDFGATTTGFQCSGISSFDDRLFFRCCTDMAHASELGEVGPSICRALLGSLVRKKRCLQSKTTELQKP